MIKINVIPNKQVGNIKFGMNRETVNSLLGIPKEFFKNNSTIATDDFGVCHIFYDNNNKCEAVEIFDDAEVYINEILVFPIDKNKFVNKFTGFICDDEELINYDLSIGIYAPYESMESIVVAKKGYYKQLEKL